MPYITEDRRDAVANGEVPQSAGELNYAISALLDEYVDEHGLSYSVIADIKAATEGAKLEFYRRVAAPYEDLKIEQNGEVFTASLTALARARTLSGNVRGHGDKR